MSTSDRDYQAILEHVTWVQRLAYRLCADAAQAEDVSQESLLSAFREPWRRGSSLRHWLVGVVRNQARMAHRSSQRRRAYESAVSPPEPPTSPEQLVERAATQRAVVTAVTELPEIYRTALLRRYFDDMGPAQIAALENVPEATVKTRLRRGLEMLRDRLADDYGDKRQPPGRASALFVALVPLAEVELRRRVAAGTAVSVTGPILGWCLAAGVIAFVWFGISWGGQQVEPTDRVANEQPANRSPSAAAPAGSAAGDRSSVAPTDRADTRADSASRVRVAARARAVDGVPVSDLDLAIVAFRTEPTEADVVGKTDVRGRCGFETDATLCQLVARSNQWLTVVPATVFPHAEAADVRVIVSRRRTVSGIVTNARGVPIAGARVTYRSDFEIGARLGVPLDRASRRRWSTFTDATGSFAFAAVPELPGAVVRATAWDHEARETPVASHGDAVVSCALSERGANSSWLQGQVRLPNGDAAADAVIAFRTTAVRSESDGRFRVDAGSAGAPDRIWVTAPGFAPIAFDRPEGGWPRRVELQLDAPCRTIRGRVVDESGRACTGIEVDLATPCARAFLPPAAGEDWRAVPLEHLALGRRTRVRTDESGQFELRGLANRGYRIVARSRESLAIAATEDVPAGSVAVEILLPQPGPRTRCAGRVTDDRGNPLRFVSISASRSLDDQVSVGTSCVTDVEGRFAFAAPLPRDARLHASAGGSHTAIDASLAEFADPAELQLVVRPAGSFFVQQAIVGEPPCDAFRLESAAGELVWLQRVEGSTCFTIAGGAIVSGRSPVYRVATGEHQLVLLRAGRPVRRIALGIRAGPTMRIDI